MGNVICLNKAREARKPKQVVTPIELPEGIPPEDLSLFLYFNGVLEGFKSHGYQVVELLVVPVEGEV